MSHDVYNIKELQKIITPIFKKHNVSEAYLVGEYARGTAAYYSSVDFFVVQGNQARANTSYSLIIDPVCRMIFDGITAVRKYTGNSPELEEAVKAVTSAYVSDARWPPLPTSPGRFNVREALDDLFAANDFIGKAMEKANIGMKRAIYSRDLMKTQIKLIEEQLMKQKYFGE